MTVPAYRRSRFDSGEDDAMGPLANLIDVMLVFAVGLMVALAASRQSDATQEMAGVELQAGREIATPPSGAGKAGSGYESVGQVYRDPQSGKLILIGTQHETP